MNGVPPPLRAAAALRPQLLLVLLGLLAVLWSWSRSSEAVEPEPEPAQVTSGTERIMGTRVDVQIRGRSDGEELAQVVFAEFRRVEAEMNEWKQGSALAEVNRWAGMASAPVSPELMELLQRGVEVGDLTGGAFDITWAALWEIWDFRADHPSLPEEEQIAVQRALVDYKQLDLDPRAGTARLLRPGMKLGLGGIAKGYALDQAAAALHRAGVRDFLLSAGGQVWAGGSNGDRPWRIGVREPRGGPEEFFAVVTAEDVSVSTSGDYEHAFVLDGVRYHHILDPRTGLPARGLRSATAITADATLADALSTALMVLGPERGLALAEQLEGVEVVFVDDGARVLATSGVEEKLLWRHPPGP